MLKISTQAMQKFGDWIASFKTLPLAAVLSLFLLVTQGLELGHSHDAEPHTSVDCEICLKLGSLKDVVGTDSSIPPIALSAPFYADLVQSQSFLVPNTAQARAPPSLK